MRRRFARLNAFGVRIVRYGVFDTKDAEGTEKRCGSAEPVARSGQGGW